MNYPRGQTTTAVSRTLRRLGVIDCHAVWLPGAYRACRRVVNDRRADAMLTSGPPQCVHLLGLAFKAQHGLPWVVDFRDPWIGNGAWVGRKRHWTRWPARLEATVIKHADAIVANAPRACEELRARYPVHAKKIVTITNGYDPDTFRSARLSPASNGTVKVMHSGEVYAGRDPGFVLDVLSEVASERGVEERRIHAHFVGRCTDGIQLDGDVRRRGVRDHVHLCGHVPYAQATAEMTESDILLLLDTPGRRSGVPAKLYEYIGAGRPILALAEPDSDVAWVLRKSGVPHRVAPPTDRAAIKEALLALEAELESRNQTAANGDARSRFTRSESARRLAEVLERVQTTPSTTY